MNWRDFILAVLITFIGGLLALLVWTLIVKQQVQAQLAQNTNPMLTALGL